MQSDQHFFPRKAVVSPQSCQAGDGYVYGNPIAPALGMTLPHGVNQSTTFHGVELQPSKVFPKNFIIFDQTDNRSRVMFHPSLTPNFNFPSSDSHTTFVQDNCMRKDVENRESSSFFKENTDDIDALLSSEEESEEEVDDDEVSTARTLGGCGNSSPDSCSTYGSKPSKLRFSSIEKSYSVGSSSRNSCNSEGKRQKMKKMVKALRGIVPGAEQMNSAAVLDEAVRYLKTLKMEAKKLGIGNFNN